MTHTCNTQQQGTKYTASNSNRKVVITMRENIPTSKVIRTRSIAFASNRSKALRNEAHATKPKCGRAKKSYDPQIRMQFWLKQMSLTDELLSIRKSVSNEIN